MSELLKNLLGLVNPVGAQREQINLLSLEKSQLVSLVGEMQSEITSLVAKAKILETENENLRQVIQRRDDEIQKAKTGRLDDASEKLLRMLAERSYVTAQQLANASHLNLQIVEFHLTNLENSHLIGGNYSGVDETEWFIAHDGRGYLIQHGLLS